MVSSFPRRILSRPLRLPLDLRAAASPWTPVRNIAGPLARPSAVTGRTCQAKDVPRTGSYAEFRRIRSTPLGGTATRSTSAAQPQHPTPCRGRRETTTRRHGGGEEHQPRSKTTDLRKQSQGAPHRNQPHPQSPLNSPLRRVGPSQHQPPSPNGASPLLTASARLTR